jgi:carboxyl-terminal processing protease
MERMRFSRKTATQTALGLLLSVLLFGIGVSVGYHHQPETSKIKGLLNFSMPAISTENPGGEITICVAADGTEAPCLVNADQTVEEATDFNEFWTAWNIINEKYVPTKHAAVSNQEKVWGAISGLSNSLGDPYTYFMPPQEKTIFEQDVQGSFGGVGMQIGARDGLLMVIAPLKGSPAERAGIEKGDAILKIDNATTSLMTVDKALFLIRGEVGKSVRLTLYRPSDPSKKEPFEVTVVREVIQVPTIDTEQRGDVFIIRLYGFPATGAELFRQALREFIESGANKLVLDLRGNPGGYLEVAVDMASWFLPQGKIVVSEAEKEGGGKVYRSKGYNVFGDKFRFVILVDGGSASAAEILAAALAQHGIAALVGTKTFGKGSVQELVPVGENTALKVTVARWITPNGTNLSEGGIDPDVKVEITKEEVDRGEDPQLDKAINILRSGKFPPEPTATSTPR